MKRLCDLEYDKAIDIIRGTDKVYFKRGVWNEYGLVTTDYAINGIKQSSYGADVYYNEKNGMYYISCPVNSDMW